MIDNIARRLALRTSDRFIIDPIFPNGGLHVITGPPDVGKTTWLLQLLYDWELGKAVMGGFKSNPCKWVYIALDRSLRDTDRTLRRLGLDHWNMPAYSIEEVIPRNNLKKIDLEPNIFQILAKFPDADLYVIEGLQGLMPNTGRGQSLNKAQMLWVIQVRDQILNPGKTIIAVNHTPKSSDASHDRENMLGSQGLIGGLGTVIKFALPPDALGKERGMLGKDQTTSRLVSCMPKNTPPLYLTYSRGINGSFELDGTSTISPITPGETVSEVYVTPGDMSQILDMHLRAYEGQQELKLAQVLNWAKDAGINPEHARGWLVTQVGDGRLVREGQGNYRRTSIQ